MNKEEKTLEDIKQFIVKQAALDLEDVTPYGDLTTINTGLIDYIINRISKKVDGVEFISSSFEDEYIAHFYSNTHKKYFYIIIEE